MTTLCVVRSLQQLPLPEPPPLENHGLGDNRRSCGHPRSLPPLNGRRVPASSPGASLPREGLRQRLRRRRSHRRRCSQSEAARRRRRLLPVGSLPPHVQPWQQRRRRRRPRPSKRRCLRLRVRALDIAWMYADERSVQRRCRNHVRDTRSSVVSEGTCRHLPAHVA